MEVESKILSRKSVYLNFKTETGDAKVDNKKIPFVSFCDFFRSVNNHSENALFLPQRAVVGQHTYVASFVARSSYSIRK